MLKLLSFKQLGSQKGIPYSRDHLRVLTKEAKFPPPITLTERSIAWLETDVDAWIDERAALRDRPKDGA